MINKKNLIVFLKNPVPGQCKTRLAQSIGDLRALQVYRTMARSTLMEAARLDASRHIFYSDSLHDGFAFPIIQEFTIHLQQGTGLGTRMLSAFHKIIPTSGPTLLIGSDCPGLSKAILEEAFAKLSENDVILGPALDGGYYLIGMNEVHSLLFEDMQYSHATVLEETLTRADEAGLRTDLLEPLSDIDYYADLATFIADNPKSTLAKELQSVLK